MAVDSTLQTSCVELFAVTLVLFELALHGSAHARPQTLSADSCTPETFVRRLGSGGHVGGTLG